MFAVRQMQSASTSMPHNHPYALPLLPLCAVYTAWLYHTGMIHLNRYKKDMEAYNAKKAAEEEEEEEDEDEEEEEESD